MPKRRNKVLRDISRQEAGKEDHKANQTPANGARPSRSLSPHTSFNFIPAFKQLHVALAQVNISIAHTQESVNLVNRSLNSLSSALGHLHHTFHKTTGTTQFSTETKSKIGPKKKVCLCKNTKTSKGATQPHRHCIRCDKKIPSDATGFDSDSQAKNRLTISITPKLPTDATDSQKRTLPQTEQEGQKDDS